MTDDRFSAPKADALPGCATPRAAEALRFRGDSAQAGKGVRGNERRNAARTGVGSPGIVPNHSPGIIVDNFAGGGGASTGIEAALGRIVDIAINHDEQAIRMHEANHPGTLHIRNNIWQVDPRDVVKGRRVELAWFSPDCKHFSKAKGGKPREKSIRDLAWVVVLWAQRVKPELILLENVEEFRTWGPLCDEGKPIKERQGETFDAWCKALRKAGYKLQFRELRACDYGAPTIRKRFFMIARRDGKPIVWPEPTHGKPDSPEVLSGKLEPWRTAAEIIDWSIPCPSIFERKKPLAEKTLRRIAHGIMKFVVNNPRPFIVPNNTNNVPKGCDEPLPTITTGNRNYVVSPVVVGTAFKNTRAARAFDPEEPLRTATAQPEYGVAETVLAPFASYAQQGGANRSVEDPLHTVTASQKDHNVAVAAFLQKFAENGKGVDPTEPLHTVMAGAPRHAVVAAHLAQFSETRPGRKLNAGHSLDEPVSTIVKKGPLQALVTSNLIKLRGTSDEQVAGSGVSVEGPLNTVSSGGIHSAEVRAFLIKYYGNEQDGHGLDQPIGTVTVQDRFGLVTVTIEGEEYVIVDIGMRMLTPRELFNAQGFPPDYIIDHDAEGMPITKTAQVAKCGNSVCPPLAEALVRANMADQMAAAEREAA